MDDRRLMTLGLKVNAGSIAPITAVQFGANHLFEHLLFGTCSGEMSSAQRIGVATAAGMASAFVSTPAELLMIQQQKHGRPLMTELQQIISKHGLLHLYRGLVGVHSVKLQA